MQSALTVETVGNVQQLASLQKEWNDLLTRSASASITLTWEWLFTWWEVFCEGRTLLILLARSEGRLVGIAPLQTVASREFAIPFRRLAFLASDEPAADETCSDYLDFIIERGQETEVTQAFFQHLQQTPGWDNIFLRSVPEESPGRNTLPTIARSHGLAYEERKRTQCVVATLPHTWDEFFASLSAKLRAQVRRHERLLAQKGEVRFRRATSTAELTELFQQFEDLHQRWWISRGKPGCFASRRFTQFHSQLAARLLAGDMVNLYLMTLNGQPLAARYSFNFAGRVFEYQTGVDPGFADSRIGLGVLCTARCIADAIQRQYRAYDFGEGVQDYKMNWGQPKRTTVTIRMSRRGVREFTRRHLECALNSLRTLKQLVRRAPRSCPCPPQDENN